MPKPGQKQVVKRIKLKATINKKVIDSPEEEFSTENFTKTHRTFYPNRTSYSRKKAMELELSQDKIANLSLFNPYKRIKRVEKLIIKQKGTVNFDEVEYGEDEHLLNTVVGWKPHFKIRTHRNENLRKKEDSLLSEQATVSFHQSIQSHGVKEKSINSFQSNFKNRIKLNRKNTSRNKDASLLSMLNRIGTFANNRNISSSNGIYKRQG